jgi:hypothetical protein
MPVKRLIALTVLAMLVSGCVREYGYWDARLAELPKWQAFGCRDALARQRREDVFVYCPPGMPFP